MIREYLTPKVLVLFSGSIFAADWLNIIQPILEIILLAVGIGIAILTFLVKVEELRVKRLSRMKVIAKVGDVTDMNTFEADLEIKEVEYEKPSKEDSRD